MKVLITKQQYRDLLKALSVATHVYGILGDSGQDEAGKYKKGSERMDVLEEHFLSLGKDFDSAELAEKYEDKIIPSDEFSEAMEEVMDDYDDETFWHELETRLGKRDFERTMTNEDKEELERTGWYPKEVWDSYEKWSEEFEKHGIDRLGVVENVVSEKVKSTQ